VEPVTAPLESSPLAAGESPEEQVLIVAAKAAWPLYQHAAAYIAQNKRTFRPTRRMGFYASRTVYAAFPLILRRHDNVMIDEQTAAVGLLSPNADEQRLGSIIKAAVDYGWESHLHTVLVLTAINDRAPGGGMRSTMTAPAPTR
jgi:hypothetical protein